MDSDPTTAVDILTIEEYLNLPEDDTVRDELVRGRLVREPRPGGRHGWLVSELAFRLESYARKRGLGRAVVESGFVLAEDPPTVRGPDLAFLAADGLPPDGPPTGFWRRAPDLAVEVVSPSNTAAEIQRKVLEYLAAGTRLVWVVDPQTRSVTTYRSRKDARVLTEGDPLDGGAVVPGFRIDLAELFATRPPGRRP